MRQNFALALFVAVLAGLAGFVAAKLDTRRKLPDLINPLCHDVPCAHFNARLSAIESIIRQQREGPHYLAIGDSITEFAELPALCGRTPINAGIGFATSKTFETLARALAEMSKPDFILLELGTNDALRKHTSGFEKRMTDILASLKPWPVIVVPAPPSIERHEELNSIIARLSSIHVRPLSAVETTEDQLHLAPTAYSEWKRHISDSVTAAICSRD